MTAFRKLTKKEQASQDKKFDKSKLTPELIEGICKLIRIGTYVETAVIMCNIGKTTFYRWIKEGHDESSRKTKLKDLKVDLRNAVAKASEEATVRDLHNIDKAAMGRKPVFDRYPKGTIIPARDDKGKVQINNATGEIIEIDVSGQIICDYKGRPIIADEGAPADWKASAWRLEKRAPKDWGSTNTLILERKDPTENPSDIADPNLIEIVFHDSESDTAKKLKIEEAK